MDSGVLGMGDEQKVRIQDQWEGPKKNVSKTIILSTRYLEASQRLDEAGNRFRGSRNEGVSKKMEEKDKEEVGVAEIDCSKNDHLVYSPFGDG